jgi:hypothetical protein
VVDGTDSPSDDQPSSRSIANTAVRGDVVDTSRYSQGWTSEQWEQYKFRCERQDDQSSLDDVNPPPDNVFDDRKEDLKSVGEASGDK